MSNFCVRDLFEEFVDASDKMLRIDVVMFCSCDEKSESERKIEREQKNEREQRKERE